MNPFDLIKRYPFLASPGALMVANTNGAFYLPRHLQIINRELMGVAFGENNRLMVWAPPQHGKSELGTLYFAAWLILLFPRMRIILASYAEGYSAGWGGKVRDVVERFGRELGIILKEDTKAKNEWVVDGYGGGMVCRGRVGGLSGRPCDLMLLDDVVKDHAEALSPAVSLSTWDWYKTVVYTRLGPKAPIVLINTRWVRNDLSGRILKEAKQTKEQWKVIKFKAIAEEDDPLGRKPGEPLWEERNPLSKLKIIEAGGLNEQGGRRWFRANWQQEPMEEEGEHFQPFDWPNYGDSGDAYVLNHSDGISPRQIILKPDVMIFVTIDWAWSVKKSADHTAIGTFGLTSEGNLLILDMVNKRYRPEELAPALAAVCRKWQPSMVGVEVGHPTFGGEYRRYPEIPEVRWLRPESTDKLRRAVTAITMSQNGRLFLPMVNEPWLDAYLTQMASFTGMDDDEDDMVDATSWACRLCASLRCITATHSIDTGPCLLTPGREDF